MAFFLIKFFFFYFQPKSYFATDNEKYEKIIIKLFLFVFFLLNLVRPWCRCGPILPCIVHTAFNSHVNATGISVFRGHRKPSKSCALLEYCSGEIFIVFLILHGEIVTVYT